jgi:hypothetical protein
MSPEPEQEQETGPAGGQDRERLIVLLIILLGCLPVYGVISKSVPTEVVNLCLYGGLVAVCGVSLWRAKLAGRGSLGYEYLALAGVVLLEVVLLLLTFGKPMPASGLMGAVSVIALLLFSAHGCLLLALLMETRG